MSIIKIRGSVLIYLLFILATFQWILIDYRKDTQSIRNAQNNAVFKKIVILSSSLNLRYIFLIPFTSALWIKLGVHPVVVLIGEKKVFENNLQIMETLKILKEMNVSLFYFLPKKISSTSLSQIIRLFGAVLPLPKNLINDETIYITTDADLAVFNLSNHVPKIAEGKTIHLYNSECCDSVKVPLKRGNNTVKMYPMGTIGATKKTWKNLMGFTKEVFEVEDVENYIINEFGSGFFNPSDETNPELVGSSVWYADQSLFSFKFDKWIKTTINLNLVSKDVRKPRRIDRIQWPTENNFSKLNSKDYDDAHLPEAAFSDKEWKSFLPFLTFAYSDDTELITRFIIYRKEFSYIRAVPLM